MHKCVFFNFNDAICSLDFWWDILVLELNSFLTPFETANSSDLAKCGYIEGERQPFPPVIKQILVWTPQKS